MNNKKIIKFPVGRKECTGIVNRPCGDFELGKGYNQIRFSSKNCLKFRDCVTYLQNNFLG